MELCLNFADDATSTLRSAEMQKIVRGALAVCAVSAACWLSQLTVETYLEPDASPLWWRWFHFVASMTHLSALALAWRGHRDVAVLVFLAASLWWNSRIHVLTSWLRQMSPALNKSAEFAAMDLTHSLTTAWLVGHSLPSVKSDVGQLLARIAAAIGVHNHVVGLAATINTPKLDDGTPDVRDFVSLFYAENIDNATSTAWLWNTLPFPKLVREFCFQSDVCASLCLLLTITATFVVRSRHAAAKSSRDGQRPLYP
ncbi:hypothetical protein CTAYLR_006341 [Chrysophaeum taylorii]|uniref:Uncharacterized protein n=1 Tax=Chrysophaeum taylorii TaxID=2483200 RepID=A0AAD7U6C3_9STRA|nr:hypothetical protein CTAYLR_006341 [Chrysophaeum taylorii]